MLNLQTSGIANSRKSSYFFFIFNLVFFFFNLFLQGWWHQPSRLFFSPALIHGIYNICSQFNSWVAEAMGVKFLAQGNNSSRKPQPGIEPGTSRLPGRCPGNLLLPPYYRHLIIDSNDVMVKISTCALTRVDTKVHCDYTNYQASVQMQTILLITQRRDKPIPISRVHNEKNR